MIDLSKLIKIFVCLCLANIAASIYGVIINVILGRWERIGWEIMIALMNVVVLEYFPFYKSEYRAILKQVLKKNGK